jgi:hypothetical protein
MASRNRYVKVTLFEPCPTNLMGSTVVGHYDGDVLLVERPQPKPRAATKAARKPRATNAKAASQPATSFGPPEVQARG